MKCTYTHYIENFLKTFVEISQYFSHQIFINVEFYFIISIYYFFHKKIIKALQYKNRLIITDKIFRHVYFISETDDLSSKISSLRDMSVRAGALASATSDKIRDLGRQIDNVKKHCTLKDAPLCDTVNTNSLELLMKFDLVSI